jgi:hypothetical protein
MLLKESRVAFTTHHHKFGFVPLSSIEVDELIDINVEADWTETLQNISKESVRMLKHSSTEQVQNYRPWIIHNGYLTVGGKIRFARLIVDFRNYYSNPLLPGK